MKKVIITKDEYIDNSVRVSYSIKGITVKKPSFKIDEETNELVKTETSLTKNMLLLCERLEWKNNENELDSIIEQHRKEWELKINS